jgi:threonine dehydrogenase-like Zn-dependent dehydrogenase
VRALTVRPSQAGSVQLSELPEPVPGHRELLVDGLAVGVCGTDREIVDGAYGSPPPGRDRLVIGHESLGRVRSAPPGTGFATGDLVVGVVRHPDPVPCGACARGEFDMCRNDRYTERGIKELDGFASESWTVAAGQAVKLDAGLRRVGVLLEPASVVAKAWEQVERVGGRAWFDPRRVLVTGAGPVGLLAALLGVQRGLEVHVLDQVATGVRPAAVGALGAAYHHDGIAAAVADGRPDIIIEATGADELVLQAMASTAAYGVICLTGVSARGRTIEVDAAGANRTLVLENDAVVGTVSSNQRHFAAAAAALGRADPAWLESLITRRVPLDRYEEALQKPDDDIKVIIELRDEE